MFPFNFVTAERIQIKFPLHKHFFIRVIRKQSRGWKLVYNYDDLANPSHNLRYILSSPMTTLLITAVMTVVVF